MMHNVKKCFLVLLLFCGSISFAQSLDLTALKESALRDAKITSQATLNMDFPTVLKHTYPGVLKLMGGKEKAVEFLTSTFNTMTEQGFSFEKADIIAVSDVIYEENEYRCFIEGYNQMTMNSMRIKSKSYLFGIYNETNKIWYFLEAKQLKNETMLNAVLPNFKTSLNIPDDDTQTEQI